MKLILIRAARLAVRVLPTFGITAIVITGVTLFISILMFADQTSISRVEYWAMVRSVLPWTSSLAALVWAGIGLSVLSDNKQRYLNRLFEAEEEEKARIHAARTRLDRDADECIRLVQEGD